MIACSVCGTENDDLTVVCSSCRSFLQTKVDNLNLFETLWGLMESPRVTFRRIALSRHKNYVILLSALFGVALVYAVLWYKTMGPSFTSFATLVGAGILAGPPTGIAFIFLFSALMVGVGRLLGGRGNYRNMYAAVAYAVAPIVYTLVFLFPIELAIFGAYLFASNPPPSVINPFAYLVLLGLDGAAILWSFWLLVEGVIVVGALRRWKAFVATGVMGGLLAGGVYALRFV